MLYRNLAFATLAATVLVGCGTNKTGANLGSLSGRDFVYVNQGSLTAAASSLRGTGSIAFLTPLSGTTSKNSFRVALALPSEGSAVTLITNAGQGLANGVALRFQRQAGDNLRVTVTASGRTVDLSSKFNGVSASGVLTYQVDVHNDENPTHMVIWDGSVTNFTAGAGGTARLDSAVGPALQGRGLGGALWGLLLDNAEVTAASVGGPKDNS